MKNLLKFPKAVTARSQTAKKSTVSATIWVCSVQKNVIVSNVKIEIIHITCKINWEIIEINYK